MNTPEAIKDSHDARIAVFETITNRIFIGEEIRRLDMPMKWGHAVQTFVQDHDIDAFAKAFRDLTDLIGAKSGGKGKRAWAKYAKVRARSANEGSGTAGWSLAAPVPACFLIEEEDIAVLSWQCKGSQWSSKGQKGVAPGRLQMIHSVRPKSHSSAGQQRTRVAVPKSSVLPAPARAENAPLHAEQTAV